VVLTCAHAVTAVHPQEVVTTKSTELPPPYFAVAAAIALFIGVGIQQVTLGNVFDDEEKASQGSTGAVARRMVMRERSFFKKK